MTVRERWFLFPKQDFSIDPKSRDAKLLKAKRSKADADRSSNLSSLYDSAINPFKISPQTSLKDCSSSLDYAKNAGIVIPPINQNFSPTTVGMGPVPGNLNYRYGSRARRARIHHPSCRGTVMSWERCRVMMWVCDMRVWDRTWLETALGWRIVRGSEGPASPWAAVHVHAGTGSMCFCIWQSSTEQQEFASCCDTGLSLTHGLFCGPNFSVNWAHKGYSPCKPSFQAFNDSVSGCLAFVLYIHHVIPVHTKFGAFLITELMKRVKNTWTHF